LLQKQANIFVKNHTPIYRGELMETQMDKSLHDLIEIIHFTEHVSAKIHGILDENKIYKTVIEESTQSKKYTVSILLLTADGSQLSIAQAAIPSPKVRAAEKATGLQLKKYTIDLEKSTIYSQVVKEGKTVQTTVDDVVSELFPKPVAYIISKILDYKNQTSILTPLRRHGKIIGAVAMSSTELAEYFIPSVRSFAQHISAALELSDEYSERRQTEKALQESERKYRLLAENATDVIWTTDMGLQLTYVSPYVSKLLGYTVEEVMARALQDILTPSSFDTAIRVFKEELAIENMEKRDLYRSKKLELELICKEGSSILTESRMTFLRDTDGTPVGILGVLRDITERKKAEEKLRESEEKFRTIAERNFDAIYEMDIQGCITYISPAIERISGYKPEEIVGKSFLEFISKAKVPHALQAQKRAINGEPVEGLQSEIIRKDGMTATIEINASPIFKDGKMIGFQGVVRDITKQKKAEEEIRKAKEFSESIISSAQDCIVVVDLEGTFLRCNRAFLEMTGYTMDELKGVTFHEGTPEKWIEQDKKAFKGLFEGIPVRNLEKEYIKKDGTAFPIVLSASLLTDETGNPTAVMSIIKDITERKQAEEQLHEYRHHLEELVKERTIALTVANQSLQQEIAERKRVEESLAAEKEQLSVTLRSIGDGVITTDTNGTIVLMNEVAETLTGYTLKEARGKVLHTVFHIINEKTRELCENPVERVLREGNVIGLANDTVLIAKNGVERVLADSGAPIRNKNNCIIGVVLVFRDITEKRRLEQELLRTQKLESLGILAGGIAHDFNNILTAILGNANLAKMYTKEVNIVEKLIKIEKASLQAKDLTQQLLTFSKGGAPVKKTTDIAELIKDTTSFALRGSNMRYTFVMPDTLWPVEIDAGQISQVINNIVMNADQAMPGGGVIQVHAENVQGTDDLPLKGGNYVKVSITDQGVGIPKKYLSNIFDPYFTTKQKGSGLGLSTCYSIIKNHEGLIEVESTVGVGTTFHVYLPASQKTTEEKEKKRGLIKGEGRVLLMDDEAFVLETASEGLQYLGYTVVTATDGKKAIDLYKKAQKTNPFDVVIMDLTVPGGMGGKETIKMLREIDPSVKAVVASGYSTDPIMSHYREYGFDSVVVKPYTIADLSRALQEVMDV
jgi:PAS domain S-box-containing protein